MAEPIIKKDDQDNVSGKEKRQARREDRQSKRAENIQNTIETDAGKYGIDLNNTAGPIDDDSKKRITENVKKLASQDIAKDIDAFSSAYTKPQQYQTEVPKIDTQALTDAERRAKRKKWAEVLYAFGQGVGGRPINQDILPSVRAERERNAQFEAYKQATEKNKLAKTLWDTQYRNDLLKFIEEQQKNENLSAAEKQKYNLIEAQIKGQEALTNQRNVQAEWQKNKPYFKPTTGDGVNIDPDYQLKLDAHLLKVRQQEGKEAADKLENTIKALETDLSMLNDKKSQYLQAQATQQKENDKWFSDSEDAQDYDSMIDEIDQQIMEKQKQISDNLKGSDVSPKKKENKENKPEKETSKPTGGSVYDDILNKYKTK